MSDTPNVDGLWLAEESVFREHHAAAVNDPAMSRVLRLINTSLVFMIDIAEAPYDDQDARTVSGIAGRIFNSTAGALRQALSGYHQTSFVLQRDLVEITTLLDVFFLDLSRITRWSAVSNSERLKEFSPKALREILKTQDGTEAAEIRRLNYQLFSEYAGHLTHPSLLMLQLPSGATQFGPRKDLVRLGHCLHELGRRVVLAAAGEVLVFMALHTRDVRPIRSDAVERLTQLNTEWKAIYRPQENPS